MKAFRITAALALAAALGAGGGALAGHVHGEAEGHEHAHDLTPAEVLTGAADLIKNRRPEQAIGLLEFGLEEHPLDAEMNLLYINLLRENGIEELGIAAFENRREEYGDEPILLVGLGLLAGNDARAEKFFNQALGIDKDFGPARLGLAELALRKQDLDGAAAAIDAVLASHPDDRRALAARGTLRMERGWFEDAVDDFSRALTDEPYAPAVHARLARAYYLLENYEAAAAEYRNALALNGDRGAYYLGLGQALEAGGDIGAARLNYRTAAGKTADDPSVAVAALKAAGRLAYLAGENEEAERHLEKAAALAPDDAEVWGFLGINYMARGDKARGAEAFAAAAAFDPSRADWWYHLGVCRQCLGEFEAAEEALERAREALTTYNRPDDTITDENIQEILEAVRARRDGQME